MTGMSALDDFPPVNAHVASTRRKHGPRILHWDTQSPIQMPDNRRFFFGRKLMFWVSFRKSVVTDYNKGKIKRNVDI